jgi:peptide/nickel transport system substrate-binding protein
MLDKLRTRFTPIVMLVAALTACAPTTPQTATNTGGSSPAATPAGPQLADKQTFVWGTPSISGLHPYLTLLASQRRFDMFDTLVGQDPTGAAEPAVATSWKSIDDTTWQFTTRTDLKFHDGTPATDQDILFSLTRAIDPQWKYGITARLLTIDSARIASPNVLEVKTKGPDPILLKRLATLSILPKAYLEKVGDADFALKPIGTGPYMMKDYKPSDTLVLTRVPEHPFRKGTLDEVTLRQIPEVSARIAGLKTGDLDFIDQGPVDQAKAMEAAGFKTIVLDKGNSQGYWMDTVINDGPQTAPTVNKLVRQALNYAIDKDSIAKNIYQGYTKVEQCQPIQPETFGFNPNLKPYPYDPAKAKQLLAQAGYPNGFKITIEGQAPTAETAAIHLFIQSELKDIGVDADVVKLTDTAVVRDKFYGVQPRGAIYYPSLANGPAMDADFAYVWFAGDKQTGGTRHYDNPQFNQIYDQSTKELDAQKRLALLQQLDSILCDDAPYLFTVQVAYLQFYNPKIDGLVSRFDRDPRLDLLKRLK